MQAQRAGTLAVVARSKGIEVGPADDRVTVTVEVAPGRGTEAVRAVEAADGRLLGEGCSSWLGVVVPLAVLPELSQHPAVVGIGLAQRGQQGFEAAPPATAGLPAPRR